MCPRYACASKSGNPKKDVTDAGLNLRAVPLTVFTLDYCIRYPTSTVKDVAAKELMTVTTPENVRNNSREERYVPPSLGIRGAGKLPQLE